MVSIALASILAAIAIPSYRYLINSGRTSSDMNALLGSLQAAKSEALKRGQSVVVCASSTSTVTSGGLPAPTCSTANNWQVGWFTFADTNANGLFDTGETVIAVQNALASGSTLVASGNTSTVRFNREGFVTNMSTSPNPLVITLTPAGTGGAAQKRCLAVNFVGRMTVLKAGQGVCT